MTVPTINHNDRTSSSLLYAISRTDNQRRNNSAKSMLFTPLEQCVAKTFTKKLFICRSLSNDKNSTERRRSALWKGHLELEMTANGQTHTILTEKHGYV